MPHFPPPPELPPKTGLFQRVPPAIFPPVLGLLGLVSSWTYATRVFGLPVAWVQLASGAITCLFIFCTVAYVAKIIQNPRVVPQDLNTLPGRTGLAAWCVAMIVLASHLSGISVAVAETVLAVGAACLLAIAAYVLPFRLRGTDPAGPMTPAMHLVFVGFILIPGAAMPMQMGTEAMPWLIWYCVAAGALITAKTIRPLIFAEGAPPLRPLQAIQLAPVSFIASGALLTGQLTLAAAALIWMAILLAILLWRLKWLTESPFSGFYSAFTFPVTAAISAFVLGFEAFDLSFLKYLGGAILIAATLFIPVIAVKILKLWASGTLAVKTNAAIA